MSHSNLESFAGLFDDPLQRCRVFVGRDCRVSVSDGGQVLDAHKRLLRCPPDRTGKIVAWRSPPLLSRNGENPWADVRWRHAVPCRAQRQSIGNHCMDSSTVAG